MSIGFDIRLYKQTGEFVDIERTSETTLSAYLSDSPASGIEVIANKVVKFMLTSYGSDTLEPRYGSRSMSITQMSKGYLPKFRIELDKDIKRCIQYIRAAEFDLGKDNEKLSTIMLRGINYNPGITPTVINIYLEIITNKRNHALVSINRRI